MNTNFFEWPGHECRCIVFIETIIIEDLDVFNIPGYSIIYNSGTLNKCDGVVIFLKTCFKYRYKIFPLCDTNALRVIISINEYKNIIVTAYYRSPSSVANKFIERLQEFLRENDKNNEYCQFF